MARPLAAILTLGCKLNLADSEEIAHRLRAAGYDVVDSVCEADAYVVNTCSVTHTADRKSQRVIRSVRRIAPAAPVAVTGCYPQSAGFDAVTTLGADLVVGTRDKDKAEIISFFAARTAPTVAFPELQPLARPLHTRAFIKAQEGCNDVCAFCIVPRTRGREESRPPEAVAAEVTRAVDAGAREVVVTGTQLGAWGRDFATPRKPHHLIARLLETTDAPRIRFSSLQPQDITPELLALWSDPRLMPHFHLALQSGSDRVLAAMRRRYTACEFIEAAARIRAVAPDAAITTDVIAGFPGESDADFEETLRFCEEVQFARLHCFPYSARSRTAAARMPDHLPGGTRKERMARLLALAGSLSQRFQARFAGTSRPVLWESERRVAGESTWFGHTDNYVAVYTSGRFLHNRVTSTFLSRLYHDGMWGHVPGGSR